MLSRALTLLALLATSTCDVSHLVTPHHEDQEHHQLSTEPPPPRPYAFSYTAGRYPGHSDRHHAEVSDGSGVIQGSYSYVDPRHEVRTVQYIADKQGFHPLLSHGAPEHPADTVAVARAKARHHQLYEKIAADHAHPQEAAHPRQTASVAAAADRHASLFRVIAEQHARIAAEREALQHEEQLLERQAEEQLEELQVLRQ